MMAWFIEDRFTLGSFKQILSYPWQSIKKVSKLLLGVVGLTIAIRYYWTKGDRSIEPKEDEEKTSSVKSRFTLGSFKQMLFVPWQFIVNAILGVLGLTTLAIRYFWTRGNRRIEPKEDEEKPSPETSASVCEETQSEGPENTSTTVPPPSTQEEEEEEEETADEYFCEYDSTWDTDNEDHNQKKEVRVYRRGFGNSFGNRQSFKFQRFQSAAKDLQNYRHDYPIKPRLRWNSQVTNGFPNLDFYLGNSPSLPDNMYIGDFHTEWKDDYENLESAHGYIQWLFPLQEPGVNPEASTLTKKEIQEFLQNDEAKKNLLESYKLMLDFYGIELCDETTGEVTRASHWRERFINLNNRSHNNLRITRILKCLGTLGFAHYQAPLVQFFLEETLVNGQLQYVRDSVLSYFLFAVLDKKQRRVLLKFAYLHYDKREEFVWCPKKLQMKWSSLVSEQGEATLEDGQDTPMLEEVEN